MHFDAVFITQLHQANYVFISGDPYWVAVSLFRQLCDYTLDRLYVVIATEQREMLSARVLK